MKSLRIFRDCAALVAALCLVMSGTAGAQETSPGTPASSLDAAYAQPEVGDRKLPIESVKPYSYWKHHAAEKPEEAIVQVRAGGASATGLVIRCDGFILVPRSVRDVARNGGSVEVILRSPDVEESEERAGSADGRKPRAPVTAAARPHPRTHATVPYALVKTTGHHVRSLPLLDSGNIVVGKPVRVLWSDPASAAAPGGVGTNRAAPVISQNGTIGPVTDKKDTFSISPVGATGIEIPSGAVVIDEQSGAAIGLVTQAGTNPLFTSFARFHVISSEVGLAPDRAAIRLGDQPGSLPKGSPEMVWVPGGPVPLDGAVGAAFSRAYGTTVACTPGFWMAVHPVTNGEYRQWLAREIVRRLPVGWSPGELHATERREDRPVCGMLAEDAAFFASSRRSRLPTEVEWRRGAYTRDTAWVEEMSRNWDSAGVQLVELLEQQQRNVLQEVAATREAARQRFGGRRNGVRPDSDANVIVGTTPQLDSDAAAISSFADQFLKEQWIWGQVGPIDAFRQDVSIFGVRNVLINAPEIVQSMTQQELYAPKLYPAQVDPDYTTLTWSGSDIEGGRGLYYKDGGASNMTMPALLRNLILNILSIRNWRGGNITWSATFSSSGVRLATRTTYRANGSSYSDSSDTAAYSELISIKAQLRTFVRAGFRCAR